MFRWERHVATVERTCEMSKEVVTDREPQTMLRNAGYLLLAVRCAQSRLFGQTLKELDRQETEAYSTILPPKLYRRGESCGDVGSQNR